MAASVLSGWRRGGPGWMLLLSLGVCLIGCLSAGAKDVFPDCSWTCSAKEVSVLQSWFVPVQGGVPVCCCNEGEPIEARLTIRLKNHTSSGRVDVALVATPIINGVTQPRTTTCTGNLPAQSTIDVVLGTYSILCGQTAVLQDAIVSWDTGRSTNCTDLNCSARSAKCYGPELLEVAPTLNAQAAMSSIDPCSGQVTLLCTAAGGLGGYSYVWHNLPAGMTAFGDTATGTLPPGTYGQSPAQVYVTVNDAGDCVVDTNKIAPFTILDCRADLSIAKSDDPDPVGAPLQLVKYTITVTNSGTWPALNVHVVDTLPGSVTYNSSSCGSCSGGCSYSGGQVQCTIGTLDVGASASIDIFVLTQCPIGCSEMIENSATVTATNATAKTITVTTTVRDVAPPLLPALPAGGDLGCNPTLPSCASGLKATDACDGEIAVVCTAGAVTANGCLRSQTFTYSATDTCGNTSSANVTYTWKADTAAPTLVGLPASETVECTAIPAAPTVTATDNCDPTLTVGFSETSNVVEGCGTITRTWSVTDTCGNTATASQTITVVDTVAPTLLGVPADATVECTAIPAAPIVTATDDCDPTLTVGFSEASNVVEGCGTITRTWAVTDTCGNTVTARQTITVVDTLAPSITCASVASPIECPATPSFPAPAVTDLCDPSLLVTFADVTTPGSCPQAYSVTRTWTATDTCGNVATCSQTVVVQDTTPPAVSCPAQDLTLTCGDPANPDLYTAWALTARASDACGVIASFTYPAYETLSLIAECAGSATGTTVVFRVVDACGNVSTCARMVYVIDRTPPEVTCPPQDLVLECGDPDNLRLYTEWAMTARASDACTWVASFTYPAFESLGLSVECGASPAGTAAVFLAADACGNQAWCSKKVLLVDTTPPIFNACPSDVSAECDSVPMPPQLSATDGCDSSVTVTFSEVRTGGACPNEYTLTRTWTATDDCRNTAQCTQTITVRDTQRPVIVNFPADVRITWCPGTPIPDWPVPEPASVVAQDSCGQAGVSWVGDAESGEGCRRILKRTYRATDECGNFVDGIQTLMMGDFIAPVIDWYGNITLDRDPDLCGAYVNVPTPAVIDDCSVVSLVNSYTGTDDASGFYPIGITLVNWVAMDPCGNEGRHLQLVVVNAPPPEIVVNKRALPPHDVTPASPGDTVTYEIAVRSTGGANIYDLVVTDLQVAPLAGPDGDGEELGVLEPGEVWLYAGTWIATDESGCLVTNSARASGRDACGVRMVGVGATSLRTTNPCEGGGGGEAGHVVISEIAWAGTQSNPEHEWIELVNASSGDLSLDGWTLAWRERRTPDQDIDLIMDLQDFRRASAGEEYWEVDLRGTVTQGEYYLLERATDDVVSDLDADLVYGRARTPNPDAYRLCDAPGEEVYLFNGSGALVSSANTDYGRTDAGAVRYRTGTPWPSGCCVTYASMERLDEDAPLGIEPLDVDGEWDSNEGYVINGLDVGRAPLKATARIGNEDEIALSGPATDLGTLAVLQGEPVTLTLQLPDEATRCDRLPRVVLLSGFDLTTAILVARCDPTGGELASGESWMIEGAGGAWPLDGESLLLVVTRDAPEEETYPSALIHLRTDLTVVGEYSLYITVGDGLAYVVRLTIQAG